MFQVILVASVFSEMFKLSTHTSEYLLKDYLTTFNKIQTLKLKNWPKKKVKFDEILGKGGTTEFVKYLQNERAEDYPNIEIKIKAV